MAIEIIRRKEGELSQKQEIRHEHTQFSLNSYGHLCIREFNDPRTEGGCDRIVCAKDGMTKPCWENKCEYYKVTRTDDEHLIVLDQKTTNELIQFIFLNRSTYELRELLKDIVQKQLPF